MTASSASGAPAPAPSANGRAAPGTAGAGDTAPARPGSAGAPGPKPDPEPVDEGWRGWGRPEARRALTRATPADRPLRRPLSRRRIRRLVELALAVVLAGAGAGLAAGLLLPPTYAARAEVLYPLAQEEPTGFLREDRTLTTQVVLMQSRTVLSPVATAEGRTVEDLQDSLTVEVLETSEVIAVEVRDRDQEDADRVLRAVLDGYFALDGSAGAGELRTFLDTELAAVRAALVDARGRLADSSVRAATTVEGEIATLLVREQDLQGQLDELDARTLSEPRPRLATAPYAPAEPVSPRPVLTTLTGFLVGVLAAAAAVALSARRTRG